MNDDKFNNKSHNALISEIRRMKKELQENKAFNFRDVKEYIGDNIDWEVIEPALWYEGNYYLAKDRSSILSALKTNGVEIKKNTFRNWVRDYKPDKLRQYKISFEYIARFTLDGNDAKKYITTRGDVLNLNLGTVKYPQHINDFMVVINGEGITGHRGYLVYKYFIDSSIIDSYNPLNELFYVNSLYEDCDISNIMRKSDLE